MEGSNQSGAADAEWWDAGWWGWGDGGWPARGGKGWWNGGCGKGRNDGAKGTASGTWKGKGKSEMYYGDNDQRDRLRPSATDAEKQEAQAVFVRAQIDTARRRELQARVASASNNDLQAILSALSRGTEPPPVGSVQ
mmetsp:Transcript_13997/g.38256  ORF Transcript_13997/g.38256 Transcript_13997/m.38256 type:complete len:137 (-) Transcript_13997:230-640(-)